MARINGTRSYNRCELYEHIRKIILTVPSKKNKKVFYDKLSGMIIAKNIKADYWEEMIKIRRKENKINMAKLKAKKSIIFKAMKLENQLKKSVKLIASSLKENINKELMKRREKILTIWEKIIGEE
jgi:hypothetical protein